VFSSGRRRRWPWRPPGQYGASTRPMAAFRGFAWSHWCAPSGDVPSAVLPRRHDHRICRRICYILFFRWLESKLVFIFLLYQFIDSIELLWPHPPPTTRPPHVCAGSGVRITAGGGGSSPWWCCLWVLVVLPKRKKTYYSYVENLRRDSFLFPPERK
jgi:hypothetical protein